MVGGFHSNKYCADVRADYHNMDQLGKAVATRRVQKCRSCGER